VISQLVAANATGNRRAAHAQAARRERAEAAEVDQAVDDLLGRISSRQSEAPNKTLSERRTRRPPTPMVPLPTMPEVPQFILKRRPGKLLESLREESLKKLELEEARDPEPAQVKNDLTGSIRRPRAEQGLGLVEEDWTLSRQERAEVRRQMLRTQRPGPLNAAGPRFAAYRGASPTPFSSRPVARVDWWRHWQVEARGEDCDGEHFMSICALRATVPRL